MFDKIITFTFSANVYSIIVIALVAFIATCIFLKLVRGE